MPSKYKTKMCKFATSANCTCLKGDQCLFAHSEEELQVNAVLAEMGDLSVFLDGDNGKSDDKDNETLDVVKEEDQEYEDILCDVMDDPHEEVELEAPDTDTVS